jgi:hypothetical protein
MKTRSAFVANSSSSSFVLNVPLPDTEEALFDLLFKQDRIFHTDDPSIWHQRDFTAREIAAFLFRGWTRDAVVVVGGDAFGVPEGNSPIGYFLDSEGDSIFDDELIVYYQHNH